MPTKESSQSQITTDPKVIQAWVEKRGGVPARVKGTGDESSGILRIDFIKGDKRDDKLEEITWDEFFEIFESANLAFLYQESTADGKESRFFKLVDRSQTEGNAKDDKKEKGNKADEAAEDETEKDEDDAEDKDEEIDDDDADDEEEE
jgi:hypothetical protein